MKTRSLKTARTFISQWLRRLNKQPFVCKNTYDTTVPINGRTKTVGCALSCALTNRELLKASKTDKTCLVVEKVVRKSVGKPLGNPSLCYFITDAVSQEIDRTETNKTIVDKKTGDFYFGLSGKRATAVTKRVLKRVLIENGVSKQDVKALFA